MLIVTTEEARAGMKLAAAVPHPDRPDTTLLNAGFTLDDRVVARLLAMNVSAVCVDYPGLDDVDKFLAPALSPERQAVYKQVRDAMAAAQRDAKPGVPYADYYASTCALVIRLMSQGKHPVFMDQVSRLGSDAVAHATAVAHLSLLLGIKLERYLIAERSRLTVQHAKEVVNLGVAGMLHDMGKERLPASLRRYTAVDAPVDDPQRAEWESHARIGYELVKDGIEPSAAGAVLHHHQKFDGTGFPALARPDGTEARMSGRSIHVFARILHAADLYDRLAYAPASTADTGQAPTPGRGGPRRSNLEILHLFRTRHAHEVDPVVLTMLEAVCPPFLPGTVVGLSDGTRAVVVNINPRDPYAPPVRRINGDGSVDSRTVDLFADGAAVDTVEGRQVAELIDAGRDARRNAVAA